MAIKQVHARNSVKFKKRLQKAKINRIKLGMDKKMLSDTRLTEALATDADFEKLMRKIERKPRKESLL